MEPEVSEKTVPQDEMNIIKDQTQYLKSDKTWEDLNIPQEVIEKLY